MCCSDQGPLPYQDGDTMFLEDSVELDTVDSETVARVSSVGECIVRLHSP
jgi:hypothetical protein